MASDSDKGQGERVTLMGRLKAMVVKFEQRSKRQRFLIFLGVAFVLAILVSSLLHAIVLRRDDRDMVKIAIVMPESGPYAAHGQVFREAVKVLADQINFNGGIGGRSLGIVSVAESDDPAKVRAAAEALAADPSVAAVLGHWRADSAAVAGPVYAAHHLTAFLLANPTGAEAAGEGGEPVWLFHPLYDEMQEARFLSNYVRNVIGEKNLSIILPADAHHGAMADSVDQILQRFGSRVAYRWTYDPAAPDLDGEGKRIAAEIEDKKVAGTVMLLGEAEPSAAILAALRLQGITNKVVGTRPMASGAFVGAMRRIWHGKESPQAALNGVLVTTPILFDTATEAAQRMRNDLIRKTGHGPDWVAAYAYGTAQLAVASLTGELKASSRLVGKDLREAFHNAVLRHGGVATAFSGGTGELFFSRQGEPSQPVRVGVYNGSELVAAPTQLTPIRDEGVENYIQEVLAGRALYVNDRFMYKTNVVYSGIRVDKISAFDPASNMAELDFLIWFRWRGDFQPQNIIFTNAVTPLRVETPEREGKDGDMLYRAYRLHGKFYINYTGSERDYGSHLVGVAYHHRVLGANNLMYVSDTLGMNLADGGQLHDRLRQSNLSIVSANGSGSLASLVGQMASRLGIGADQADPLIGLLNRTNVLGGVNGWLIDKAWMSEDLLEQNSDGDPVFVGFGKPHSRFSSIDFGILLKPDAIRVQDVVPRDYFPYIAVFAAIAAGLASLLDRKERGQFWKSQTLFLRLVSWPLLLSALDNLARNYSMANFSMATVDSVVLAFDLLWWAVPARLVIITIEQFLWVPLEHRTGRKVPRLIRQTVALVVIVLTVFGIIAFVLNKPLTSLLATSGLVTMIIGLSVQANLRDVFSGLILHLERPFTLGDYVKIGSITGTIVDITWRTIRVRSDDGFIISFPNGKASEAEIQNLSRLANWSVPQTVFVDAAHDPQQVMAIISACMDEIPVIMHAPAADNPTVHMANVELVAGEWAAKYAVRYCVPAGRDKLPAATLFWKTLWAHFAAAGIRWHKGPSPLGDEPALALPPALPPVGAAPALTGPALQSPR